MGRMVLTIGAVLLYLSSACGHRPATASAPVVRAVEISGQVVPQELFVLPGEEVRWTNRRANAVRLGFLSVNLLNEVACEKGIATVFGTIRDLVIIPPGGSVSLCFAHFGELKYNVWFDAENPRGAISPTATIYVSRN